ncbi:MAG: pyridoxal phosphate-dependent aminotransferase [Candidatus Methanoperedenaceae archaeon]|nr:pyridoxal phosphate-dependent aminotransferase [Candidatus Methanoperedenaceae archaeon]
MEMFSERVKTIDISGIRKMFEGAGPDAINMGLGQPDFDTPEHIKKAAIDAINEGFTGYTMNLGIPELRGALCRKFERDNNFSVSPDEVIVTAGASEALHLALQMLLDRGDEVLVPDPGFVSYPVLTGIAGGKAVSIPPGENLNVTPEAVNELITRKTKAIIVNSPSNPTGTVQTKDEIRGLAEISDDNNITIISDEVYEHFIYKGKHASPAEFSDNVITINAVSKTYAMTGWRIGYAAARKDCVEQMLKVHQYIQACACSVSQKAALAAIEGPQDCVGWMRESFRKRRDILMEGLNGMGIKCVRPEGAFYAFPEVAGEDAPQKLIENGVIVAPGTAFGKNGKGHIRLSYATSENNIRKALEIMEKVLV